MLEKLILYFVLNSRKLTTIQLYNFIYLADLYSVKWGDKQLTDLQWTYQFKPIFSPYHVDIDTCLVKLKYEKRVILKTVNKIKLVIARRKKNDSTLINLNSPPSYPFSKGTQLRLNNIIREWGTVENEVIHELLDYVNQTEPIKQMVKNHLNSENTLLDLSLEKNKWLAEFGD